jgi:hypothetical protein
MTYILMGVAFFCIAIVLVHVFVRPIPYISRFKWWVLSAGAGALLGLAILIRPIKLKPTPEPVKPKEFDDEPDQRLDAKADDTTLDFVISDDDLSDLERSNEGLESRLQKLALGQGADGDSDPSR